MISDKTLRTLEFDKILDRLQDHASFAAGKQAAGQLRPATDLATAQAWLVQTAEARQLLQAKPSLHLGGAHDVREAVQRAQIGSVLTPAELLDIGSTLGASARFRSAALRGEQEIPWLHGQAERMTEDQELVERLEQSLSESGEMLDSASSALRRIRSDIQTAQGRLMDRLNSMITSATHRASLQEPVISMRNGRYVVPVRQDAKAKVPGIVHDESASGQTLFVEPTAVTEMNNRLKSLELREEREIERILRELSDRVARRAPELKETVEALSDVDVALAKAKYAEALKASRPALNDQGWISFLSARHPLLHGEVVPITIHVGKDFRVLVITGPNTGGKTVALKTAGLLTLMAQAGMHISVADGSEAAVFAKVFADIGDEQSIEQSLSTFSSHVGTIISTLPDVDENSLVLFDELGAGTDPAEGAALAQSILETLLESGARSVITTHYSELKTFAHEQDGVENASVEFDVETLSPTYRLVIGLPGRSQALAIAKRLGMPDKVLNLAREYVATGSLRVEKLLAQIQSERQEIGELFERAKALQIDTAKIRDRARAELRQIKASREHILAEAREEAAQTVRELRQRLRDVEEEAKSSVSRREQRALRTQVDEAQHTAAESLGSPAASEQAISMAPLAAGSSVSVLSLGQTGTLLSVADGEAEVQVGQFKMRLPLDDLQMISSADRKPERSVEFIATRKPPATEIDVRGWRADEALTELDQYLHDNFLNGQETVRIVHGKGTGALRTAIRKQLAEHPLVQSFEAEKPKLGGDGVTVVKLGS